MSFKKKTKRISSGQVQLWTEGLGNPNAPAVMFVSGAGAHAHFWTDEFCLEIAQEGFFVLRFDHRDTGLSSPVDYKNHPYTVMDLVEDVIAILDAYHIEKANVVGHSMGGIIAQLLAIHHPERLLSFVSMSVATVGESVHPPQEVMEVLLQNNPTQVYEESLDGFMKSWRMLNGDVLLDEDMARAYTKELYERSLHPVGVAWNHIHCQENLGDLSNQLQKVKIPSLFIHGEKDVLMPLQNGIQTAKAVPQAKIEVIPKMGHMIFNRDLQKQIASLLVFSFFEQRKKQLTFKNRV
jgi:pimeloyl-ACP methyl ester carboxylesterase